MTFEPMEAIAGCIKDAREIISGVQKLKLVLPGERSTQMLWIQGQISQLLTRLKALQVDLDAGCSVTDLGFVDSDDLEVHLQSVHGQLINFQALLKGLQLDR